MSAAILLLAASCSGDSISDEPAVEEAPATTSATSATNEGGATATTPTTSASATTEPEEQMTALEGELVGFFSISPADCDGSEIGGSYFRMIQPGGSLTDGPFVPNADSSCGDASFTPMIPGTDGGLTTQTYQPAPDPAFDDAGNGLSNGIVEPTTFFAVAFAIATEDEGNLPSIVATDGSLSGDLSAWTAYYGNLIFLQGAPLPDGSMPGLTAPVTGTIDVETGEYTLEWSSQIIGGSFNDFTGIWHLEGIFEPAG